jgi:hypothetical protein
LEDSEKSYKGALKLEVPKMPKVEEFNPSKVSRREPKGLTTGSSDYIYNKRWSATRRTRRASACAAGAPALRERDHNFRHFRSLILGILDHF